MEREPKSISDELKELHDADQADRAGSIDDVMARWEEVKQKDQMRLERVDQLYEAGLITTAEDLYHAAMIYQHGGATENYAKALELSRESMELGSEEGKWLYPRAEDRYLMSIGKPQIWGTQFQKGTDGMWRLMDPFDESAKTAEERHAMGVDSNKRASELNELNS